MRAALVLLVVACAPSAVEEPSADSSPTDAYIGDAPVEDAATPVVDASLPSDADPTPQIDAAPDADPTPLCGGTGEPCCPSCDGDRQCISTDIGGATMSQCHPCGELGQACCVLTAPCDDVSHACGVGVGDPFPTCMEV